MAESGARKFTLAKVIPDEAPESAVPEPGLLSRFAKAIRRQPGGKPSGDGTLRDINPIPLESYVAMAGQLEKTPVTEFSMKFLRDMVYTSDLLSLIVRTKTNETFRSGFTIEERFKCKCQTCGREFEEEKLFCPYDDGELIQPDYAQWKTLNKFLQNMNRFDESLLTTLREVDTDIHICDNGWLYLERDYWFGDDGNVTNEEVKSVIRMDANMMRLIMSRYGMGTSETGSYAYFCIEHRTEIKEFPDKGEHKCKCGKVMIPAWYCALTRAERLYYGPREIYHIKLYSNAQAYGVPPLMSCWMKVNALLRMDKFILEAYSLQRAPQELLILRGKRDSIHRNWEWLMQKARENPNMVYPLVLEGDDGSKTRVVEHETFSLKPIEWQWTSMREEYRNVVGAVYGVQPIFATPGSSGSSGGLANEGLQIMVTTMAIKQEQHQWNVMLEFLSAQLGCSDYMIKLNPNEQEDEVRDVDLETKRLNIAQAMTQLGYEIELHKDAKGRMEFSFKEKPPELPGAGPEDLIPQDDVTDEAKDIPPLRDPQSPEEIRESRYEETRRREDGPPVPREYGPGAMSAGLVKEDDMEKRGKPGGENSGPAGREREGEEERRAARDFSKPKPVEFAPVEDWVKVCEMCGGEAAVPELEKSYKEDRLRTLNVLSGGAPKCNKPGCHATLGDLMIAHLKPDEFTGYAARSGGANYARWMMYVREHPENYKLFCPTHHSIADKRTIPGPAVHRKDVRLMEALAGVGKDSAASFNAPNPGTMTGNMAHGCSKCGSERVYRDGNVRQCADCGAIQKSNYTSAPSGKIKRNPRGDENIPIEDVQGEQNMNLLEAHSGGLG